MSRAAGLRRTLVELDADVKGALEELTLPAGIVDAPGVLRWANGAAREVLGDDVVGQSFFRLIDPLDVRAVREDHARIVHGPGQARDSTATLLTPDGRRFRAELSGASLKNGEHVVGVFGIARLRPVEAEREQPAVRLTPRQAQVLRLLACGRSTVEIAAELGIAVETTRNHIRRLLHQLDSHSRIEAVVRAYALGLVDEPPSRA